ncbi:MAG: membrane lipoprotein lipid attachment site-containing protein [Candidatus Magasanikiibacteriota bacterium]
MKKIIFALSFALLLTGCATTGQDTLINDDSANPEQSKTITQPPVQTNNDIESTDNKNDSTQSHTFTKEEYAISLKAIKLLQSDKNYQDCVTKNLDIGKQVDKIALGCYSFYNNNIAEKILNCRKSPRNKGCDDKLFSEQAQPVMASCIEYLRVKSAILFYEACNK